MHKSKSIYKAHNGHILANNGVELSRQSAELGANDISLLICFAERDVGKVVKR